MANKMEKYTKKQLLNLVRTGVAIDVSSSVNGSIIQEHYIQIGYSEGVCGCTGILLKGNTTDRLYVALGSYIYRF